MVPVVVVVVGAAVSLELNLNASAGVLGLGGGVGVALIPRQTEEGLGVEGVKFGLFVSTFGINVVEQTL